MSLVAMVILGVQWEHLDKSQDGFIVDWWSVTFLIHFGAFLAPF